MSLGKLSKYKDREQRWPLWNRAHRHGWANKGRGHPTTGK